MSTKRTTQRKTRAKKCPDCQQGQVSATFKVGGRKKQESPDRQEALCLTCLGTGEAPNGN
ncbi:hypothetical protein [Streptomyces sp. NPDC053048]|uniref:hypothetical protein n=1 Tax=Streptomyces sp. NPDC053048 TaxID=3365694 RepID=UPI0037D51AAE